MPGGFSSGFSSGFGAGACTRTSTGLLLRDTFDRANGAPGANYALDTAGFAIASNALASSTDTAKARVTGVAARKDFHVQVLAKRSALSQNAHIWIRANDAALQTVYLYDTGASGDGVDPGRGRFYRRTSGGFTRLGGGVEPEPGGAQANVASRHTVSVIGSAHAFWLDGRLVGTATDATVANDITGYVTLMQTGGGTVTFDDLIICGARVVTVNGLPAGYQLRIGELVSAPAVAATALAFDILGSLLPCEIEILDTAGVVVGAITDVYGGDVWAYALSSTPTSPITRSSTGLLFADDFNRADGAPGANYTTDAGSWAVAGNRMVSGAGGTNLLRLTALAARKDSHVQVRARRPDLTTWGALRLRSNGSTTYYMGDIGNSNDGTDPNRPRIYKVVSAAYTKLASHSNNGPLPFVSAIGNRLAFSVIGSSQRIWTDGLYIVEAADATVALDVTGHLVLESQTGNVQSYDDLIVCTGRIVTVSGLPTGYMIGINGIMAVESGGTATLDMLGTLMPASLVVCDATGSPRAMFTGVYGGDVFAYSPTTAFTYTGTGGVHIGGTAPAAPPPSHFAVVGSGGVIVAGSAMPARGRAAQGSGGVLVGGTAAMSTYRAPWIVSGSGGVVVGGTAGVTTNIAQPFLQLGVRDYTGPGTFGDRDPGPVQPGEVVERTGAVGTVVTREGAMGAYKPKPPKPSGGRKETQHFFYHSAGLIKVRGGGNYAFIPNGAPLPPDTFEHIATGGVVVGGVAAVSVNIARQYQGFSHGGVSVLGTAPASKINIPLPTVHAWHGSGGVRASGSSPASSTLARHYSQVAAGGVRISGSAPASSTLARRLIVTGSGLVIIRGGATVSRIIVPIGGGGGAFTSPVAPATFDTSRNPAHFATGDVVATSLADLQNRVNTAPAGTRIRIPLGVDWMGTLVLPNRGFGPTQWIEIAPDMTHAAFEAARAYGRRMNLGIASTLGLPTLRNPGGNSPVVTCDPAAAGFRFTGIQARLGGDCSAMIRLGYTDMASAGQACKRLIWDRGTAVGGTTYWTNRAFMCVGEQIAVLGTWIADIYGTGDSQGILTYGWQGPYVFKWNRVEGWGMGWMSGGAETAAGGVASDVTFEENHVTKNTAYRYASPFGSTVKNLIEAKSVRRASVKRNIIEYDWADGQPFPLIFKSVDQDGNQPQQGTIDYEFAYNWVRNIPGGFNLAAQPQGGTPMSRVYIHNNLMEKVNTVADFSGNGIMLQLLGGLANVTLDHNTYVKAYLAPSQSITQIGLEGEAVGPIAMRSNIIPCGGYGLKRSGSQSGVSSWNDYIPNPAHRIWQQNVLMGLDMSNGDAVPWQPAGTIGVANDAGMGYADLAGGNYQIIGPLATAGHDGLPVGIADYPAFMAALASVQNG